MSSKDTPEDKWSASHLLRGGPWSLWSAEAIVLAGFLSILLILAVIGGLAYRNTVLMKRDILWVDHTHDVVEMLKDLELDVREAEAGLRTYMITGDVTWRNEYRLQAFDEMNSHLAGVRRLSADSPDQMKRLDRITPLINKRVALFEELLKAHESDPGNKAYESDLIKKGALESRQLISLFHEFADRENANLASRIAKRESDARFLIGMLIAGGTLGFLSVSISLFLIFRALRSRRRTGEKLRVSLNEKEILLKEVHHRVKNNLQVISSLLSLESGKIDNQEAAVVFKECRDRIHMMAKLHQQLYSKGQFAFVDFGEHLREMAGILVRSHMPAGSGVTLEIRTAPMIVDFDTANTLGLIANEVILNSLKHAFTGRTAGKLSVELHDGDCREIVVCDDGNGLPRGGEEKNGGGLGLELVLALSRQINGETIIENRPQGGTCITIRFPAAPSDTESIEV